MGWDGMDGHGENECAEVGPLFSEVSILARLCGAVRQGYICAHVPRLPPTLPGQVSIYLRSTCCCTCRILLAEAEKGGRTAEADSSPGRYFARLSPTHACRKAVGRRSGGATVCQDCHCHVSACGESDRLWPACQPASLPAPARPRPPPEMEGGWTSTQVAGGLQSRKKNTAPGKLPVNLLLLLSPPSPVARPPFSFPAVLRAACRQSTQASSSGGNSSMPALPLAWNLANRSPNLCRSLTHSLPQRPFPAAGSHLPSSLIASHRIASRRPGVQACQGRAISPLETFPFLLGTSSSAASRPVPGHQMQTAGLEQTKLKQTRPSARPLDWSLSTHHHSSRFFLWL